VRYLLLKQNRRCWIYNWID